MGIVHVQKMVSGWRDHDMHSLLIIQIATYKFIRKL